MLFNANGNVSCAWRGRPILQAWYSMGVHAVKAVPKYLGCRCAIGLLGLLFALLSPAARAQTYTIIHNFTGGADGATPMAGLTIDQAGNLYGATNYGGNLGGNCGAQGCGLVYRLSNHNSGWALTPLYSFQGGNDGMNPQMANVVIGQNGSLYSTTFYGGGSCGGDNRGCGTVFELQPPANPCGGALCPWMENILHSFNGLNGSGPVGALVFDAQGNLYGATNTGGVGNGGTVYQLNASAGWMEEILFIPYGYPGSSVTMNRADDFFGSTFVGASGPGAVYQLTPSGSNWIGTFIYDFTGGSDGAYPVAGVILDPAGNIYGATTSGGASHGGTVFELSPSNGSWAFNLLYSFTGPENGLQVVGPVGNLIMDSAGNLYGTTFSDGEFGYGAVFKLTSTGSGWTYTSLHDFTNGSDGGYPYSNLVFDSSGNIYGTASSGGSFANGVIFKLSP